MTKALIPYLAGILTVLILSAVFNLLTHRHVGEAFEIWTKNKQEKVISTIESDAGFVAVLKNTNPNAKQNRNMASSRWNEKRIVLTPNREKEIYVDIELRDGHWSRIQVFDSKSHKQVTVSLEGDNQFKWAQIFGKGHMSMDKNFDGLVDLYSEHPPKFGKNGTSKVFYVTDSGTVEGVFGKWFVEEKTNQEYRLTWDEAEWKKEYKQ